MMTLRSVRKSSLAFKENFENLALAGFKKKLVGGQRVTQAFGQLIDDIFSMAQEITTVHLRHAFGN